RRPALSGSRSDPFPLPLPLPPQQLISQTREKQPEGSFDHQWLGKSLLVKHDKIRSFLVQLRDRSQQQRDWPLTEYEQMIFDCRDCLQLLRDTNSDKSPLYQYLSYVRLDLIIKRNLLLIAD